MDKAFLINSAAGLPLATSNATEEYSSKADLLAAKVTDIMGQRPDIISLIGTDNLAMMQDNHANHSRFISSILKHYNPEILTDTMLWVFRAYRSHGFTTNYWAAQLNTWIHVLNGSLSKQSFEEIIPLYEWMQINIPIFVLLSDEQLTNVPTPH